MKTKSMTTKTLSKEESKRVDLTMESYEIVSSVTRIFLDKVKTKILLVLTTISPDNTTLSFSQISKLTGIPPSGGLDNALTTLQKHALVYKEENSSKLYGLTDAGKITGKFYIVLLKSLLIAFEKIQLPKELQITTELLKLYIENADEILKKLRIIPMEYPTPIVR